jgi:hypothetical protein
MLPEKNRDSDIKVFCVFSSEKKAFSTRFAALRLNQHSKTTTQELPSA